MANDVSGPDISALARDALAAADGNGQANNGVALDAFLRAIIDGQILRSSIRRFLFSEDDVATAEQQALVAISFNLHSWSGEGPITPWLRQIAANEAKMIIRARDRRRDYEGEASNATIAFVERLSSHLATQADLDRCIAQLDTDLAVPLALRRDGYSYREIAAKLDLAEGTVKTRVRTARTTLANLLARGAS